MGSWEQEVRYAAGQSVETAVKQNRRLAATQLEAGDWDMLFGVVSSAECACWWSVCTSGQVLTVYTAYMQEEEGARLLDVG